MVIKPTDWDKIVQPYTGDISLLVNLIKWPTVYDKQTVSKKSPHGKALKDVLLWLKKIAEKWGLKTHLYRNEVLGIQLDGKSSNRIESVCHVDVVSVSGKWRFAPFSAEVSEGNLYGRGTQDMKFQLWSNLLSLKIIKDQGIIPDRTLRLVIGTDEERTMTDIKRYIDEAGLPEFAYTPDGSFPLCLGEKGVWTAKVFQRVQTRVSQIRTYQSSNAICDRVDVWIPGNDNKRAIEFLAAKQVAFTLGEDKRIIFLGKSAHSSLPEDGENAIIPALKFIDAFYQENWAKTYVKVFANYYGTEIGIRDGQSQMGKTTLCLNRIRLDNSQLTLILDARYNDDTDDRELEELTAKSLPDALVTTVYMDPVTKTDMNNRFVDKLLKVYYQENPDDSREPYYSGGVSYSKAYSGRCVAFGIEGIDSSIPKLAHQTDEHVSLSIIPKTLSIYTRALYELSVI